MLQRVVDHRQPVVRRTAQDLANRHALVESAPALEPEASSSEDPFGSGPAPEQPPGRNDRRRLLYQQAHDLRAQGISQREIARRLHLDRGTVARYLSADAFPERASRRSSCVHRFADYLRRRWQEGCYNAAKLTEEIRAQGFHGSYYAVRRYLARWRSTSGVPPRARASLWLPSSRQLSWWLLQREEDLEENERAFVQRLQERIPAIQVAAQFAREFRAMVRERRATH